MAGLLETSWNNILQDSRRTRRFQAISQALLFEPWPLSPRRNGALPRQLGAFNKLVLLSATPNPDVLDYLQRLLQPRLIDGATPSERPVSGERTAVHPVDLIPVPIGADVVETATGEVTKRWETMRARRATDSSAEFLPAVTVLNSVVNAIHLEDRLVEEGIDRSELAIIRGLSSRAVRDTRRKVMAIGTAAIEVGMDFRSDWLIFEASEAGSFMQRFGRVGRHAPGAAIILCPPNVLTGLTGLSGEVSRAEFEEKVSLWYADRPAYAWFVTSYGGLVTTRALVECILSRLREDFAAEVTQVEQAAEVLGDHWRAFAGMLDADAGLIRQVERHFARMAAGRGMEWLRAYTDLNTFRTSLPSEWVHDYAERDRRGDTRTAEYEADIGTLLHRAEGLRFNPKWWNHHGDRPSEGMLTVRGYGQWRPVRVTPTFEDRSDGEMCTTAEYCEMRFLQDYSGHLTSISHVMTLRPHVFTVLPSSLQSVLDWRVPVFTCGHRIIAFDGAALLAREIWQRNEARVVPP